MQFELKQHDDAFDASIRSLALQPGSQNLNVYVMLCRFALRTVCMLSSHMHGR